MFRAKGQKVLQDYLCLSAPPFQCLRCSDVNLPDAAQVAQQQVQALEASKLDMRYANEEVVLRVDSGHAKLLQEVQAKFRQQLDKAAERCTH